MRGLKLALASIACISLLMGQNAGAALVRIIHTNDLHSHFEHATEDHRGNFASVKYMIDALKADAAASNISSIVLDAGDFSEGSEFYFANRGLHSFRILNSMGYDAVTLGNHEWLMGANRLNEILEEVHPPHRFLAANIDCPGNRELDRRILPYTTIVRNGVRIAILGLTTDDKFYSWVLRGTCSVGNPKDAANRWVPVLRQNHDFVVALTHLGVSVDRDLIRNTSGIDLVIGGHSHTYLHRPETVRNNRRQLVPLLHAGRHGEWVGSMLVDLTPGFQPNVLRYDLVPVHADGPKDAAVLSEIQAATRALRRNYGGARLTETIGFSAVPLVSPATAQTEWGDFIAEAMRAAGRAQIGMTFTRFHGVDIPNSGPVRRIDLMRFYPRQFEPERRLGWRVYTVEVPGFFIDLVLNEAMNRNLSFSVSGLDVQSTTDQTTGRKRIASIKFNGRPIDPVSIYKIAGPEGFVRGGLEVEPFLTGFAFEHPIDTRVPIWRAIETLFRERGGQLQAYPADFRRIEFNADDEALL